MKSLGDLVRNAITEAVMKCSEEYGFSGAEALDKLNLDRMEILSKLSAKKSNVQKAKVAVASIPFPFMGAVAGLCCGLKQNYGLYTQCPKSVASGIQFCKGCEKSEKNVHDRSDPEFKDSKGRPPKSYSSVMKKLKLTKQQVLEEAAKFGITIGEEHFVEPEAPVKRGRPSEKTSTDKSASKGSKKRGRPNKTAKVVCVEDDVDDLFASLVSNAQVSDDTSSVVSSLSDSSSDHDKKTKKLAKKEALEAEKLAKKEALEAEKLAKKEALEAEKLAKKEALEAEKLAKEAEKLAKKEALEAEKLAKKEALEAEKLAKEALEAEKLAKKEALEAEKLAKKEALEAEKLAKKEALEAEKLAKEAEKLAKKEALEAEKLAKEAEKLAKEAEKTKLTKTKAEEPQVLKVKKFEHKGVKYLKSANNVVYSLESQDEVGTWDEDLKEIIFKNDEESEEEYESENEDN